MALDTTTAHAAIDQLAAVHAREVATRDSVIAEQAGQITADQTTIATQADRIAELEAQLDEGDPEPAPDPAPEPAPAVRYPSNAGVVVVNADNTGATDAAPAIRSAQNANDLRDGQTSPVLSTFAARTVHIPAGNFRIQSSLAAVGSSVCLAGAGVDHTVLHPVGLTASTAVIDPGTKLINDQANSGFANHVRDLTIDFGASEGIGIRLNAANSGGAQRIAVLGGTIGLSLDTTPGPCLVDDALFDGCRTAVRADQAMPNNIVFSRVTARDADVAVDNNSKSLLFEDFVTEGCKVVYQARSLNATMIVIGGHFTGGQGGAAFDIPTGGFLHLRDVYLEGYTHIVPGVPVPEGGHVTEWSTHSSSRSYELDAPHFPQPAVTDPADWHRVSGSTFAQALIDADNSGAEVAYLSYGRYNLGSNVTLRNIKRLVGFFSEVVGSGTLTLAPTAGETMVVEDLAAAIDVVKDGPGDVAMRHLGPVAGDGSLSISTGSTADGTLWLQDWGPHAAVVVNRPVHVVGRQINREGVDWTVSGGAQVVVIGDNCETNDGRGTPRISVSGSNTVMELLGGTWDNLGDSTSYPRSGPAWLYLAGSAKAAIVMPSLLRSGGLIGLWIDDNGVKITDERLVKYPARGSDRRTVMPLYVSR